MYVSLGLLWLCFKIIQGEINLCPMGGVDNNDLCLNLKTDSIFYRFYLIYGWFKINYLVIGLNLMTIKTIIIHFIQNLDGFQTEIIGNKENKYDVYDIAFDGFKENSKKTARNSELNVMDPLDVMRPYLTYTNPYFQQTDWTTIYEYKEVYRKIIFRQSLIVNCNPVDPELNILNHLNVMRKSEDDTNFFNKQGRPNKEYKKLYRKIIFKIKTLWEETLSVGTDTYRLKFHNKLISTYKDKEKTLSKEDCMVFIESYYNAASTYYFWKAYITALYVIEDGIKFGLFVRDEQFIDDLSRDSKDLNAWLWLCESLKQDIIVNISPDKLPKHISKVSSKGETTKKPIGVFYSTASVLFYRRYFLDNDLQEDKKKLLEQSATKQFKSIKDNDIIYTKYNLMYNYLVLAKFGKTDEVKLENVIKAIQLPVLSIEDRLLNYKALSIAMEMLHLCLDENGLLATSIVCAPMNKLKNNHSSFREKILPKLKDVYQAMHDKDIIMKLICSLSTKDAIINERILHVIVTSSIDINELDPTKHKSYNLKKMKSAIKVLEYFVEILEKGTEKSENNKFELEESDTDDFSVNDLEQNYTDKMVELLSNITYSNTDQKIMNIFIAYKWLAELYGALCLDSYYHLSKYQKRLNKYIGLAYQLSEKHKNIDSKDDHLKYLKNKQDAKILIVNNVWEINYWPGGWFLSNLMTETGETLDTSKNGEKSKMLEDLNYLRNESKCPYINKIEINILLYRLYVMDTVKNDYKQLYQYLASAINEVVVTCKDRARNMEAHELFSVFLMILNRNRIEKMCTGKDHSNINNTSGKTMPSDEVQTNAASQKGWFRQYITG